MPIPVPDFEGENQKAIRKNLLDVVSDLDKKTKAMEKKVFNFAELFGFSVEEVKEGIRQSKYLQAKFAKDPSKQNLHEDLAAKFIAKLPGVDNFRKLPKGGKNALQVFAGSVRSPKEIREEGGTTRGKTIDFTWKTADKTIYASHKHTTDGSGHGGGGQTNQYEDLQSFIREANESNNKDVIFLAIADGPFYALKNSASQKTNMDYLKDLANSRRNVFALSSKELEDFLKNLSN